MHRPFRRLARLFACWGVLIAAPAPHSTFVVAADHPACVAPRALTKAVNRLVESDIPGTAAQSTPCDLTKLPGSLAKLLPLLPNDHRTLIQECARGRVRLTREVSAFDLPAMIEDHADRPDAVATIRAFFDERAVDVAMGQGLSDEPYPISFDWAVVLDPGSGTLFSFVLNCHD
ncbi:MAG: hypothetical protein WCR51_00975 [Planctomycetia bacterium]